MNSISESQTHSVQQPETLDFGSYAHAPVTGSQIDRFPTSSSVVQDKFSSATSSARDNLALKPALANDVAIPSETLVSCLVIRVMFSSSR